MKFLNRLSILAALALAAVGCNTSTQPGTTNTGNNQVQFTQNTSAVYYQNRIDTANGQYGAGQLDPRTDTVTSTTVKTDASFAGKSPVVEIVNQHSNGTVNDTTYLYQDANGDLYRYNYGVEALNNNATVTNFLGSQVQLGWVLQAKMNASPGTTWTSASTTVAVSGAQVPVTVTATMDADTTVNVNGEALTAKHVTHKIYANALIASATGYVDTYVTTKYGMVLNVLHPTTAQVGLSSIQSSGTEQLMVKHS